MARLNYFILIVSVILAVSSMNCYAVKAPINHSEFDIEKIQKLTGNAGQFDQDEKIYKIIIPHDDLKILMSGMQITSSQGLSSRIYFKEIGDQAVVSGDLILLQDQVNPVMSIVLTNGLEVVALNNPYLWDFPRVMVMRIKGEGHALQLASAIGAVLRQIKMTANGAGDFPFGDFYFPDTTLDTHKIDVILGVKGELRDNVYQIRFNNSIKKPETETNRIIAANTWAAFAGSDNEAVVNGSMVIPQSELQKALVKLRNAQIYIFAIYQYAIDDNQGFVAINFWGVGNVQVLAKALRSTFLVAQNTYSSQIKIEGVLAGGSTLDGVKEVADVPLQLSVSKNNYCDHVNDNALYTAINKVEPASDTPKMVQHAAVAAQVLPTLSAARSVVHRLPLPSASAILSRLSVVKNNKQVVVLLSRRGKIESILLPPVGTPPANQQASAVPAVVKVPSTLMSPFLVISARSILSRLSVVKNNKQVVVLLSHPRKTDITLSPMTSQVNQISASLSRLFAMIIRKPAPVLQSQARLTPVTPVISARAILARLSVVKNNQWVRVLLPRPSKTDRIATPAIVTSQATYLISAKAILARLSVIKNNQKVCVLLPRPSKAERIAAPTIVMSQSMHLISAKAILAKLSIVKHLFYMREES